MIVAIIILALSTMNVPGLGISIGVAQGQTTQYPLVVALNDVDRVFFATHTSSKVDGNWIELGGGTSVKLPSLNFVYEGPDIAYTIGGITVKMESDFIHGVTYPVSTHRVYKAGQTVSSTFWGTSDLGGQSVSFILLRLSYLSQLRDILNEGFSGAIVSLLDSLVWMTNVPLNSDGDGTHSFTAPAAGDYLLAAVRIDILNQKVYAYSATAVEVVDDALTVSSPSSVEKGDSVNVNSKLSSEPTGSYIHAAALIKESAYSGMIKIKTDGDIPTTQLYINGVLMADGILFTEFFQGTKDQSDLTIDLIEEKLMTAFSPYELAFGYTTATHTGSISLSTSSMPTGDYILLVGVWKDFETRIVGLKQITLKITAPYTPPSPPVNQLPVAEAGPDQKAWVNEPVYFDGSDSHDPDGYLISWDWSFGDGETASGETASHEYPNPGTYTVTLTVKDTRQAVVSDTCTVEISEPPAPVSDKYAERVAGGEEDYLVDATEEANTTVTLNTIDPVTVTILKYESNPHPEDPIPAMALPNYVDVEVSNPDAVTWPIYVEISYTDEEIGELDEYTFGIYYWMNGAWQRCSDTGVDTERNVVWAYMTAEEASGSPIVIAGMHAITPPPLPPILDNLIITPSELELGDNVTISFDIENYDSQSQTYGVDIHIENVNDPPPTWPPYHVTLRIWVELEAYESKTVLHTITMDAIGDFNVTVHGMTDSFKVGTWPPPKPAEFIVSDLTIEPEEVELEEGIDTWTFRITVDVTNIGEQEGSHTVDLKIDGDVAESETVTLGGGEDTMITFDVTKGVGSYTVEVDGLTGNFVIKPYLAPPKPAEFVVSDLSVSPDEVEPGRTIIVSAKIANIGETKGTYILEFKVDGKTAETESVTLAGGTSQSISFTTSLEVEGIHTVEIDGLSSSFTVTEPPTVIVWWMRPVYMAGILILVASAGAIIYYLWKGKHLSTIFSGSK